MYPRLIPGYTTLVIQYLVDPYPTDEDMAALWMSAWGQPGPASFANILSRSLGHVGAFESGSLVAFVNLAWDGGVHAFILDTCVHEAYQRRGIGTALVRKAIDVACEREIHWLHVDYEKHLDGFYRRCGFQRTSAGLIDFELRRPLSPHRRL
jgi:ribosomal protein S18 acetylase RimI-like enzyme